jgi:hypothetical protein
MAFPPDFNDFQFVVFIISALALCLGAYTHQWGFSSIVVVCILHFVFWPSDFVILDAKTMIWYIFWTLGLALAWSAAGVMYAKLMYAPPGVLITSIKHLRKSVHVAWTDLVVGGLFFSLIGAAAGLNFFLKRTLLWPNGLSPLGVDLTDPGLGMLIGFSILFFACWVALFFMDYDARITGKYAILLILPQISHLFFFLAYYKGGLSEGISSVIAVMSFLVLHTVAGIVAVKMSVAHHDVKDKDDMYAPDEYDVFLGRWRHALWYYGGLAVIIGIFYVVHGGVTYYATKRSLEMGSWISLAFAGLVLVGSFLLGQFNAFDFLLEETKETSYVSVKEQAPQKVISQKAQPIPQRGYYPGKTSHNMKLRELASQSKSPVV